MEFKKTVLLFFLVCVVTFIISYSLIIKPYYARYLYYRSRSVLNGQQLLLQNDTFIDNNEYYILKRGYYLATFSNRDGIVIGKKDGIEKLSIPFGLIPECVGKVTPLGMDEKDVWIDVKDVKSVLAMGDGRRIDTTRLRTLNFDTQVIAVTKLEENKVTKLLIIGCKSN